MNLSHSQLHGDSGGVSGLQRWDREMGVRIGQVAAPEAGDSDGEDETQLQPSVGWG